MDEVQYINKLAKGIYSVKKRLRKDVVEMCKLLNLLVVERPEILERPDLKTHLQDIYWSLKFHLVFHFGNGQEYPRELQELGGMIGLENALENLPDQNSAIDPWSKLMEIVIMHFLTSFIYISLPTCILEPGLDGLFPSSKITVCTCHANRSLQRYINSVHHKNQ